MCVFGGGGGGGGMCLCGLAVSGQGLINGGKY